MERKEKLRLKNMLRRLAKRLLFASLLVNLTDMAENQYNQPVFDITDTAETKAFGNPMQTDLSQIWGEHYQTEQDPMKMASFRSDMKYDDPNIRKYSDLASNVFAGEYGDLGEQDFKNLLYYTGIHESGAAGGVPRTSQGYLNRDTNEWVTAGPARSYWQVEPNTLRDIVTATHDDGTSNYSTAYWGPKAQGLTKVSAEQLFNMSDDQLSQLLEDNPLVGATAAGAKYVKSFK